MSFHGNARSAIFADTPFASIKDAAASRVVACNSVKDGCKNRLICTALFLQDLTLDTDQLLACDGNISRCTALEVLQLQVATWVTLVLRAAILLGERRATVE